MDQTKIGYISEISRTISLNFRPSQLEYTLDQLVFSMTTYQPICGSGPRHKNIT